MPSGAEVIEKLLLNAYIHKAPKSPIKELIALFKDKWSFLVLFHLTQETKLRFSRLQKKMTPVSNKALSKSLWQLEKIGFIQRMEFAEVPLRVEYCNTAEGKKFFTHFVALLECFIKKQTSTPV